MTVADEPPKCVVLDASLVLRYVLHTQVAKPVSAGLKVLQNVELLMPALWRAA